ncbi:MAG: hypothetical protein C0596_14590 [Marinilabiliales bacterium]|nr:MAG: hypothetical protein C0596_14590 [Marinilabiliales bacterium]
MRPLFEGSTCKPLLFNLLTSFETPEFVFVSGVLSRTEDEAVVVELTGSLVISEVPLAVPLFTVGVLPSSTLVPVVFDP